MHSVISIILKQAIREKIISLKISKNKLNKNAYELIKNIEIISVTEEDKTNIFLLLKVD